jgi:hypothetical protein
MDKSSHVIPFRNPYVKRWPEIFSTDRQIIAQCHLGSRRRHPGDWIRADNISMYWSGDGEPGPSPEFHDVEQFCRGVTFQDLELGIDRAGQRIGAWIDEMMPRGLRSSDPREYRDSRFLTATGLYRFLESPVCR